jgi:hypothetical protein
MPEYDAFVSYSRRDEALVQPVVKLLSVSNRKIFWDAQVAPGDRWMESVAEALAGSRTVIVIWCCHAARSKYVEAEVQTALGRDKTVVPVLICPYPLHEPLDEIQGVDFRDVTKHSCLGDHPVGSASTPIAAREFEDPDAVSAVDMWLTIAKPRSTAKPIALAAVIALTLTLALPLIAPFTVLSVFLFGMGMWATGRLGGAPMSRESLRLAGIIETAIRRAERRSSPRLAT